METLFLGCFLFGLVFTVASLVLGELGHFHVGHAGQVAHHVGAVGHHGGNGDGHDGPLAGFGLSSVVLFLSWFGATGYVFERIGALVARIIRILRAGERVLDPRDFEMVGTLGRVTVAIPAEGVGEIVFAKGGTRRSEAARGKAGRAIARETEVIVTGYARGIATVEPWDDLAGRSNGGDA